MPKWFDLFLNKLYNFELKGIQKLKIEVQETRI